VLPLISTVLPCGPLAQHVFSNPLARGHIMGVRVESR
jgi:hypothetical protein